MLTEFLNKYVYIHIEIDEKHFYYTCALVTEISETHIGFKDDYGNPNSYRVKDIVEIKLSNKAKENQGDTNGTK